MFLERKNKKDILLIIILLTLVTASVAQAQNDRTFLSQSNANVGADLANIRAATDLLEFSDDLTGLSAEPGFSNTSSSAALRSFAGAAEPFPGAPEPKFAYGKRDDFRWQLGLGIALVRFRSSQYYATGVGTNTSLTYFTHDWLGVEASTSTASAPKIYKNEHVKYFSYGAGPRIAARFRKWEPWAHTIIGGCTCCPKLRTTAKMAWVYRWEEAWTTVSSRISPPAWNSIG
jgi:hypothetical protein